MLATLCALLPALAWVSSQKVLTQTPSVLTDQGRTVSMDCNIAKDENYVAWYKQVPEAAPQFVLSFYYSLSSPNEYGADFPSARFTSKASSNIDYQLIISNVEVGDSAVYYCGTWDSSASSAVGQGTKLIVTDSAVPPPVLTIFPPSSEELKSNKATLVCVVSDLSTGFADVRWLVGGNPVSSGVTTGSAEQQPNKKFRLSSYLSIERSEWDKDKDITCEVSAASKATSKKMKKSECTD
ncbi:immunoglobulin lambda-1 light chain-like isoform X2 [Salminus brasiliensis]|uniref:immunoglobulin lambda-1 light chain-like isoform X2 n=1 Tax=Salminus brasiliensis TaxID=930266 RepID=UPI003B8387CE